MSLSETQIRSLELHVQLEVERLIIPVQTLPEQLLKLKPSPGFGQSAFLNVQRLT